MGMFVRVLFLYLNYLRYKFLYRKNIWFRGFAVIYAEKGASITFSREGRSHIFSHPFSNMIGLSQKCIIVARGVGKIDIGSHVCMSGCTLYSVDSITIGKNTDIGSGCKIIDTDFHPLAYSHRYPIEQKDKIKHSPITIGDGCFIGTNSIILKGTNLGNNVVVGAGSVVCGTFPDNVIIAGNPARIIRENEM